eukprot:Clim_evm71s109 gene=Clim_evmTU71s109
MVSRAVGHGTQLKVQRNYVTRATGKGVSMFLARESTLAEASSLKGKGKRNEDRTSIVYLTPTKSFYGVYDGHGGSLCSQFIAEDLPKHVEKLSQSNGTEGDILKDAYALADDTAAEHLREQARDNDDPSIEFQGTTACTAILNGPESFTVASIGDSRAILASKGIARVLTWDHEPDNEQERERIEACGGYVSGGNNGTTARLQGRLAMSRAFGDLHLRQYGLIATPDIHRHEIDPNNDQFLLLVSDGVCDVMSAQYIVDQISLKADDGIKTAVRQLTESAVVKNDYADDASAVLIKLPAWGKFRQEAESRMNHGHQAQADVFNLTPRHRR